MRARPCALALMCAMGGCVEPLPPRGQLLLYVDTDAPVPAPRGAAFDPGRLSALVDRARFEVLVDGDVLPGSSRDFVLDEDLLRAQRLSFGVLPAPGDGAVAVRVRLFRADRVRSEEPPPGVALDTVVSLPPVAPEGITEVSIVLRVDDFGRQIGPVPATPGRPAASVVGTWRGGRHVPCDGLAREGEACVPGGAFFMGDPDFRGRTLVNDMVEERLAWVSPFFLDRTEVTVGAFRARWAELAAAGAAEPLARVTDANGISNDCTWGGDAGAEDPRVALSCVPWDTARAYCRLLGADLPTEAQLEYVASALGEEWAFPWGNDEPTCSAAVWGRGGSGAYAQDVDDCRVAGVADGVAFPGAGSRDRLDPSREGGPEIVDLGGNLSEWALDMWSRPSEPFWSTVTPMVDPLSMTPGVDGDARPVRGGAWPFTPLTTRAAFRRRRAPSVLEADIGFRCARAVVAAAAGGGP